MNAVSKDKESRHFCGANFFGFQSVISLGPPISPAIKFSVGWGRIFALNNKGGRLGLSVRSKTLPPGSFLGFKSRGVFRELRGVCSGVLTGGGVQMEFFCRSWLTPPLDNTSKVLAKVLIVPPQEGFCHFFLGGS